MRQLSLKLYVAQHQRLRVMFCAISSGAGIKCNDNCITIIIINVDEKPNQTALFATLRP